MKMKLYLNCEVFVLWTFLSIFGSSNSSSDLGPHASIKSKYGQLVTSSTLRWRDANGLSEAALRDAVPSGTGNPNRFVCRSEHHGMLLIGQTTKTGGHCTVGFVDRLLQKHRYEVLINIDHGAKLEWRSYNKFGGVPEGSVAGVDDTSSTSSNTVFIGRHLSGKTGQWEPGAVEVPRGSPYSTFGVMRIFDPETGAMEELSSGDVLVEIEPVRYELEILPDTDETSARRPAKTTRQDVVLAKSSLFRFEEGRDVEARLQKVLTYTFEKSEYFGQVPGMIRALPTLIRLPHGQMQSQRWGLAEISKQQETLMVGHALKHHTAVDVSIVGIRITEETPYRATLTSVFEDGSRRTRTIEGVSQRKYLNNIRPEYSRVYQIKDSVYVNNLNVKSSDATLENGINNNNNGDNDAKLAGEAGSGSSSRIHRGSADQFHGISARGMSEIREVSDRDRENQVEQIDRKRMLGEENKQQLLMSVPSGCGASALFRHFAAIMAATASALAAIAISSKLM